MYIQEKSDILVQTRLKSTSFATIARFFALKGLVSMTKSSLLRLIVEEFEGVLIKNELTERITNIVDARRILAKLGLENLNPGGRGGKNYMEEMQREVYNWEGWDPAELEPRRTKADVEGELKKITSDPVQMGQVIDEAQRIATAKQAARSKAEHDELGNISDVPIMEEPETS